METWNGFELKREIIFEREALIVSPKRGTENGKWALKTEYFEAFPDVQIKLLHLGYHVVHIKNKTRWHISEDSEARAILAEYMNKIYGLSKKCAIIGMSCGGMQGIYFASKYPEYVSCMYLDAPVVNFLSCPFALGKKAKDTTMEEEFTKESGITRTKILSYRGHPLDYIPDLLKYNIPIILVCGDSDTVVPYEENGKLLNDAYKDNGKIIKTIIKKGANHHPHGLDDNGEIVDFILKYDR